MARMIRDIISKPSEAVYYMIKGLLRHSKRPDFEVRMKHWYDTNLDRTICYGCAASCAVQEITGVQFKAADYAGGMTGQLAYHASCTGMEYKDLSDFERAVDQIRCGNVVPIFMYFDISCPKLVTYNSYAGILLPTMNDKNWKRLILTYKTLFDCLRKDGF